MNGTPVGVALTQAYQRAAASDVVSPGLQRALLHAVWDYRAVVLMHPPPPQKPALCTCLALSHAIGLPDVPEAARTAVMTHLLQWLDDVRTWFATGERLVAAGAAVGRSAVDRFVSCMATLPVDFVPQPPVVDDNDGNGDNGDDYDSNDFATAVGEVSTARAKVLLAHLQHP